MMVWGNLLDAQKAADHDSSGTPSLVPKTWELIRCPPGAGEDVIAKGVLIFDVYADGSLLYSNGSGVYHVDPTGAKEVLAKDALIEQVVAVEA
jgi:hypothetical protein